MGEIQSSRRALRAVPGSARTRFLTCQRRSESEKGRPWRLRGTRREKNGKAQRGPADLNL